MRKLWHVAIVLAAIHGPSVVVADGVNAGLQDPLVVPSTSPTALTNGTTTVIVGSNASGRPGVSPDQIYGYDVNIAYDHVVVGMAVLGGIFLMTEWMDAR